MNYWKKLPNSLCSNQLDAFVCNIEILDESSELVAGYPLSTLHQHVF